MAMFEHLLTHRRWAFLRASASFYEQKTRRGVRLEPPQQPVPRQHGERTCACTCACMSGLSTFGFRGPDSKT
jgi:hypothetical protein